MSTNRVIGRGSEIPWHLPEDFRWFKRATMGQVLLMGRKTFDSIGRPLPGRETWILSRSSDAPPGVVRLAGLEDPRMRSESREIWVCGGGEIYRLALPYCGELFLTRVKREVDGDVFFPDFEDRFQFQEILMEQEEFDVVRYMNPDPLPLP